MASRYLDIIVLISCVTIAYVIYHGMFGNVTGGGMALGVPWSKATAFPWHPVLMTVSFSCFMVLGRWSYYADSMWGLEDKSTRRLMHGILMGCAIVTAIAGYACIALAHWDSKQYGGYNFKEGAWEEKKSRIAHSWLGYVAMLLVFVQATIGPVKAYFLSYLGERILTFHGRLGVLIILMGGINILLAVWFWGWDRSYKILVVISTTVVIMFGVASPAHPESKSTEQTPLNP